MSTIKLLIADDHEVVRSGLKTLVEGTEIEVVGEVGTGEAAVQFAMENDPDVVADPLEKGGPLPLHRGPPDPPAPTSQFAPTPPSTLNQAYDISKKLGFNFVYIGNMVTEHENTNCPQCGKCLVKRDRYLIQEINIKNNDCPSCQTLIAGVWS